MKILNDLRYIDPTHGVNWAMRHDHVYAALGLDPKKHLPDAGLPPQMVGNTKVWVDAKIPGVSQDAKRVWCECATCGKVLTAGKLQQHVKVHGVKRAWAK